MELSDFVLETYLKRRDYSEQESIDRFNLINKLLVKDNSSDMCRSTLEVLMGHASEFLDFYPESSTLALSVATLCHTCLTVYTKFGTCVLSTVNSLLYNFENIGNTTLGNKLYDIITSKDMKKLASINLNNLLLYTAKIAQLLKGELYVRYMECMVTTLANEEQAIKLYLHDIDETAIKLLDSESEEKKHCCLLFLSKIVWFSSDASCDKALFSNLLIQKIIAYLEKPKPTNCHYAESCSFVFIILRSLCACPTEEKLLLKTNIVQTTITILEQYVSIMDNDEDDLSDTIEGWICGIDMIKMLLCSEKLLIADRLKLMGLLIIKISVIMKYLLCWNKELQSKIFELLEAIVNISSNHVLDCLSSYIQSTFYPFLIRYIATIHSKTQLHSLMSLLQLIYKKHDFIYEAQLSLPFISSLLSIPHINLISNADKEILNSFTSDKKYLKLDNTREMPLVTLQVQLTALKTFFRERDIDRLKYQINEIAPIFDDIITNLKPSDIIKAPNILAFLEEMNNKYNESTWDSESVKIKTRFLIEHLFTLRGKTILADSLIQFLNTMFCCYAPIVDENLMDSKYFYLVFLKSIRFKVTFHCLNSAVLFEDSHLMNGCDNIAILNNYILSSIFVHPQFIFARKLLFTCNKNIGDIPFLRYAINGHSINFRSCVYDTVLAALRMGDPNTPLDAPFTSDIELDITVLQENEFTYENKTSMCVNRTVDITKVTEMPELTSTKSSIIVDSLKTELRATEKLKNAVSHNCFIIAQTLRILIAYNKHIERYNTSYLWKDVITGKIPELSTLTTSLINYPINQTLSCLLHNSCVDFGKLIPEWLYELIFDIPELFSFKTRKMFLDCYNVASSRCYINLFSYLPPSHRQGHAIDPPLFRFTLNRDNVVADGIYIASICDKLIDIQLKFHGEEGIGSGPTHEFMTLYGDEIQRRDLHLWHEPDEEPYPIRSSVHMLNYPLKGPDNEDLIEVHDDEINGAFERCFKCAALHFYTCPVHHCILSLDRKKKLMYCRECDYTVDVKNLSCEYCGLKNSLQEYWLAMKRSNVKDLLAWFDAHPSNTFCYFGSSLCSYCSFVHMSSFSTDEQINVDAQQSLNQHEHQDETAFQCVLRCMMTRHYADKLRDALLYTKPCQHIIPSTSLNRATFQYTNCKYGLFPNPLFELESFFEESKSLLYSLGVFLALCLQDHMIMDLNCNPLFLEYIRLGMPKLNTIDGAVYLLSKISPDYYKSFKPLIMYMKQIQLGESVDIDSLMLDASLPTNPSFNLIPEYAEDVSSPLTTNEYPLWLSRYIQYTVGEGIRPVIELIRTGMASLINTRLLTIFTNEELNDMLFGKPITVTEELFMNSVLFSQGYSRDEQYIQDFITTVLNFNSEEKEKFLLFVTGQKRVSKQSIKSGYLFTVVEKDNGVENSLPTSATCTRELHLPRYKTKEEMKAKLLQAINMAYNQLLLI